MLNLPRLRPVADHAGFQELAPVQPISGAAAYDLYVAHTLPLRCKSAGDVIFPGKGGPGFIGLPGFIGPPGEDWDLAMLVGQADLADFAVFEGDAEYLAGLGPCKAAALQGGGIGLAAVAVAGAGVAVTSARPWRSEFRRAARPYGHQAVSRRI